MGRSRPQSRYKGRSNSLTYVIPIWHPAAILRGQWAQDPFQPIYLRRAKDIADGHTPSSLDPETPPPGALLDPTVEEMWDWALGIPTTDGSLVSCDIETAGDFITTIGFTRLVDFVAIVLRFRRCGGETETDGLDDRIAVADYVLSHPKIGLVFQNGQAFDVPRLEDFDFRVAGYFDVGFDTMLASFCCFPDAPKDLEHLACVFAGFPKWKYLVGSPEGDEK